jgi:sterol desaturase/sphingolipid hydroxylase (fatty acid hydroxylase superfamily)
MQIKPLLAFAVAAAAALLYGHRSAVASSEFEPLIYLAVVALAALYGLWWLMTARKRTDEPRSNMPRGVKVSLASLILTLSLMLLVALILLPFLGAPALMLVVGSWSPIILIVGAIILIPFVGKKLH